VIGSGSASFELIRSLVDCLPVMITLRWVHTAAQPIAIEDVIEVMFRGMLRHIAAMALKPVIRRKGPAAIVKKVTI
jgi:hypothetical protein